MIDQGLSDPSLTAGGKPAGAGPRLFGGFAGRLSHRAFSHRPAEIQPLAGAFSPRRYHDQRAGYRPRFSPQHPGRPYPAHPPEMGLAARRPDRHHRHLHDQRRGQGPGQGAGPAGGGNRPACQAVPTGAAPKSSARQMEKMPNFKDKIDAPVWRDLIRLAAELDGFPKYMGQHPGGMILSSTPLTDIVPVQRGAIEGRYVCQWDKDSIDDAGFVKIDFLALGALSQLQDAVELIKQRTGKRIDMSRIDFEDAEVYDMLCKGDTIGIFQVESAAQMQTITRLRPRNLLDMAHEVGAVRPGVGVNHGVQEYLARRSKRKPVTYDHPLEKRALERTLGVILFQDQVNQLAIDVAGFAPSEADRLRRAFGRRHNEELIEQYRQKFLAGAKSQRRR